MEFWVAVGTGVLALATFVLAGISAWNVKKTGALVTATESLASSTKDTVKEIQQDRELAHRPYLSWHAGIARQGQTISAGRAYPTNFGRGPIVHGLCCYAWNTPAGAASVLNVMTTDLFDLSADADSGDGGLLMTPRSGMMADADVAGNEITEGGVRVAFCQDQLGNYFRFVPYHATEILRPVGEIEPKWMQFYRDQFSRLSKP